MSKIFWETYTIWKRCNALPARVRYIKTDYNKVKSRGVYLASDRKKDQNSPSDWLFGSSKGFKLTRQLFKQKMIKSYVFLFKPN